jgi:hypothetical protein
MIKFKLKQKSQKTDWVEYILQSGILDGEAIEEYYIEALTELADNSKKFNEYSGGF